MKKILLFGLIVAVISTLCACASCPVPDSAPRTYSMHTTGGSLEK